MTDRKKPIGVKPNRKGLPGIPPIQNPADPAPWLKTWRYVRGQSGNPKGKPKGTKSRSGGSIRKRLLDLLHGMPPREMLEHLERYGIKASVEDVAEAIALNLVDKAVRSGDMEAIKEILKQTEAPLQRNIGLGGFDGGPVVFVLPDAIPMDSELVSDREDEDDDE